MAGRFDRKGLIHRPVVERERASSLDSATRGLLPFSLFNRLTTPLVNRSYYASFRLATTGEANLFS